jgi:RHS repeat-associated protein
MIGGCDTALNQCVNYGYDEFDRLNSRSVYVGTANNFTYAYDRYGNRWQQTVTAGSGPQPQYSFNTAKNQISGSSYDAAGNLTNDGAHSYTYDAEGNITAVDGGQTATYTYDALNRRVETVVGGTKTDFVYNANGQRASTWNGANNTQIQGQYYWGSKPVGYYRGGSAHFQHQDWLGTERIRTTYNGTVEGTFTSLPFGDAQTTASGTDGDQNHYAQLDYDPETSTSHAQFRQYNSTQGRWMRPDPSGGSYDVSNPRSFNRYTYVMNNPLSLVDPLGLQPCDGEGGDDGGGGDGGDSGDGDNGGYDPTDPDKPESIHARHQFGNGCLGPPMPPSPPPGPCVIPRACYNGPTPTSGSGGTGNAPNNTTPWYKTCTAQALGKGLGSTALDAIGIIPEGGTVSAAFSLWHGAAGVSNGIKIQQRVAFAAGFISTANAAHDLQGPQESTFSSTVTGLQAAAGGFGIAKGLIEDIPVAGQAIAIGATALDLVGTGLVVAKCYQ